MKRPLAVIGFAYLAALVVAVFLDGIWFVLSMCLLFLGFAFSLKTKKLRCITAIPVVLLTGVIAFTSVYNYSSDTLKPVSKLYGKTALVSGELCDIPYSQYGCFYYKLKANRIESERITITDETTILVSSSQLLKMDYYDRAEATVNFSYENTDTNISKGILLKGSIDTDEDIVITATENKPLYYYALCIRKGISDTINSLLPERQAAFLNAFLTGDKKMLQSEDRQQLQKAGLSHIVVVSGFHLALVTQIFMLILMGLSGGRKRISALMCVGLLVVYMGVTGFPPSVLRAGIMQIIYLLGIVLFKQSDPLNSLGLSVLIITLRNPFAACDVSLLLSFSATLGILLVSGKINTFIWDSLLPDRKAEIMTATMIKRIYVPLVKAVCSVIAVSFSAYLFTMPVMIVFFREINLYSVLSNLLTAFVLPLLMFSAIIMLGTSCCSLLWFITFPFVIITGVLTNYILLVCEIVSALPFALIRLSWEYVPVWVGAVLLLAGALYLLRIRKYAVRIFSLTAALSFFLGNVVWGVMNTDVRKLYVLDTGSGITVLLTNNNKGVLLSCGGDPGRYYILEDILEASLTDYITYMLLSDNNNSASLYADDILSEYDVRCIEVYNEESFYENVDYYIKRNDNTIFRTDSDSKGNRTVVGDTVINSICTQDVNGIFADIGGFKLLICYSGSDMSTLPEEYTECDVLIINGKIRNLSAASCGKLIISDSSKNKRRYKKIPQEENVIMTYDGGNIAIRIYGDRRYELRRENNWLS